MFHLNTIYLAQNNTNIFMSGVKGNAFTTNPNNPGDTTYQNLLYVLPNDGSCGSQSCALHTITLPTEINQNSTDWRGRSR